MTDGELVEIIKEVDPGFLDDSQPFKEYIIGLPTLKKIIEKVVEKNVFTDCVQKHL